MNTAVAKAKSNAHVARLSCLFDHALFACWVVKFDSLFSSAHRLAVSVNVRNGVFGAGDRTGLDAFADHSVGLFGVENVLFWVHVASETGPARSSQGLDDTLVACGDRQHDLSV